MIKATGGSTLGAGRPKLELLSVVWLAGMQAHTHPVCSSQWGSARRGWFDFYSGRGLRVKLYLHIHWPALSNLL